MNITRRTFLNKAGLAAAATSLSPFALKFLAKKKLNILVLGGTNFVGPPIVKALTKAGHTVTLFNRGKTNAHFFPDLKKIKGDREKGLTGYENLKKSNLKWDWVIDVWPYEPQLVKESIEVLKDKTTAYAFISSIATYRNFVKPGMTENAPRREGDETEEMYYNLGKTLCEKAIEKHFPNAHIILRPGAIVGERDSGPFTNHILKRFQERKAIIEPDANDPVQFIDVKDVACFLNQTIKSETYGSYNLVGPKTTLGYKDLILKVKKATNSDVEIHWADPAFLTKEMKLEPFVDIPFWIPVKNDPEPGFYQISNEKALSNGLKIRSLDKTIKDVQTTFINRNFEVEEDDQSGIQALSEAKEADIIEKWVLKNAARK